MLGSSQNIAMPNVVLNTTVAESFRQFADRLEAAEDVKSEVKALLKETFSEHKRIIFDGNGYSDEWQKEAERRGLLNLRTSVDAYKTFDAEKNVRLFERHGVMSEVEIKSRQEILFENYSKIINIEALTMIEMATREIIPAVNSYVASVAQTAAIKTQVLESVNCTVERDIITKLSSLNAKAYMALGELKRCETEAARTECAVKRAEAYVERVLPAMEKLRAYIDEMETMTSSEYWPLPSYGDMMFNV
jgi:glutamine synthetase